MGIGGWLAGFVVVASGLAPSLSAQGESDEYRVYTEHPRLILTAQRLRLLKRERERESQRWRQFELLVKGSPSLPEPGFALALYYAVAGDEAAGKKAVEWALGKTDDLRQLALIYDWCQPVLTPQQSAGLSAKIHQLIQKSASDGIPARRDRILALIATADGSRHLEEAPLKAMLHAAAPPAEAPLPDLYPLLEMLHAVRDNLKIDLREGARGVFCALADLSDRRQLSGAIPGA